MGPRPAGGSVPPRDGRIPWGWDCSRCGKVAADTWRAVELAKKPCGCFYWSAEAVSHELEAHADRWRCNMCMLVTLPQHAAQAGRQACPVPELAGDGARWHAGESNLRAVLG